MGSGCPQCIELDEPLPKDLLPLWDIDPSQVVARAQAGGVYGGVGPTVGEPSVGLSDSPLNVSDQDSAHEGGDRARRRCLAPDLELGGKLRERL